MTKESKNFVGAQWSWRDLLTHSLAFLGLAAVVVQLVDTFLATDPLKGRTWALGAVATLALLYGLFRARPRAIDQTYNSPKVRVRIVAGDLFELPEAHTVIGMTDTFDTQTPAVISESSIQAQFLSRVYGGDKAALDRDLNRGLRSERPVSTITKSGKTIRYPIGTTIVVDRNSRKYFCVAYSEMDLANRAHASVDGLWLSLGSLWRAVDAHGNGGLLATPVVGGGLARLTHVMTMQDLIHLMVLSFLIAARQSGVCDELLIVVRPEDYKRLNHAELRELLYSLNRK